MRFVQHVDCRSTDALLFPLLLVDRRDANASVDTFLTDISDTLSSVTLANVAIAAIVTAVAAAAVAFAI